MEEEIRDSGTLSHVERHEQEYEHKLINMI